MPYGYPAYTSPEMMKRIQVMRSPEFQAQQKELVADILKFKNIINNTIPKTVLSADEKTLQFITLNRDWESLFKLIPNSHWGTNTALDKYSFRVVNGIQQKVPLEPDAIQRYVFSRHLMMDQGYMPPPADRENLVNRFVQNKETIFPGRKYVLRPRESTWDKLKKPLLISAGIIAAIYLGPIVLDKVGALYGSGSAAATGTGAAGEVSAKATFFAKVKSGTNTVLGYVNKARTVEAIVKGELPPPPISIAGSSFTEWAKIVVKKEIQDAAIEKAMETGQKYIAKKMTEKEEAKLQAEIDAMQRQLLALMPADVKKMSPEPDPELATPIKRIQVIEEKRADDLQKLLIPGVIVAGMFLLGG